jgi:hypothetical protein
MRLNSRFLRPWRKNISCTSPELPGEEWVSTSDHGYLGVKKSHDIIVQEAESEQPQLVDIQEQELQEHLASSLSIILDSSDVQRECVMDREEHMASSLSLILDSNQDQGASFMDQLVEISRMQVEKRRSLVPQPSGRKSKSNRSLSESPIPFAHEIHYTYKADKRSKEDIYVKELFNVPPPDGTHLRTVHELLEGSDSLHPWLRDMLLEASAKVEQAPYTRKHTNASNNTKANSPVQRIFQCESVASTSAGRSEMEEEETVTSSFSDLSETMEEVSNPCRWLAVYFFDTKVTGRSKRRMYD